MGVLRRDGGGRANRQTDCFGLPTLGEPGERRAQSPRLCGLPTPSKVTQRQWSPLRAALAAHGCDVRERPSRLGRHRCLGAKLDRARTARRHRGIAARDLFADHLSAGTGPKGDQRVIRGGSWNNKPRRVRSANRDRNTPDNRNNKLGFRLAQSIRARAVTRSRVIQGSPGCP